MASGRVIVVGSVNIDFVVSAPRLPSPGDTVIGGSFARHGGGKGANKALAAARAGAETVFVCAVGDDPAGDEALTELASAGVDVSSCRRLPGVATGVALIVVDASGENQIAAAPGANAMLDAGGVEAALAGLTPRPADVVLADFEVGPDAVLAAARWAQGHALRLVVNPAPARPLDETLLAVHPILTPNATEAAMLSGVDDPAAAARALARRSGAPVVVTLGEQGALAVVGEEEFRVPGHRVATVDATGAGDALSGILSAELARGATLRDALRRAVAGAALSTTAAGAREGLPGREAIERFLEAS